MEKITLKKIIYKNYLKTTLTSIFFIELALLILYFNANNNILQKSTKFVLKDVKESVYDRVKDIKYHFDSSFLVIENNLKSLQNEQENFFEQIDNLKISNNEKYKFAENGMYYNVNNETDSSVIVSKNSSITNDLKEEIKKTKYLEKNLKANVVNNQIVVAGYFNSRHNYSRYYPFINKAYNSFPADLNMKNYNFYYKADIKHNPEKKVTWTNVYLDPAGQGWMISAIAPIYKNDVLQGVVGLDVTVDIIIRNFLTLKIPYKGESFLIDKNLEIIAMSRKIAQILKVKNFNNYEYEKDEKISNTIFKSEKEPLKYKSIELKNILKDVVNNKKYKHDFLLDGKRYFIFTEQIEKLSWHTITLIKEDDILSEVKDLEKEYLYLGLIVIILIVLFYLIFFIYLHKKANDFVYTINKPLSKIINMTKTLGSTKKQIELADCGIMEIDEVNKNFNKLAKELENRTEELIKTEASRAMHEELSNTDALTKVYNRRFLEDFSKKYFEILKREKGILSILLVDIDDFKAINDNYGHDMGDQVLLDLVDIMKEKIRENDFIVRLGGDEFLILLPNSNINGAKTVAQKLIDCINKNTKNNKKFTVSIGCSEYNINDKEIHSLIKRADTSLYDAKKDGKNKIV
ncbi:MAG: diguanylate cyclase [Arcobacter sp.]|uniref:diguanylate cyclase n=1 Tax=Arcobacter sp. TaxID=1872629 RepID=UPI003AFFC1ED